MKIITLAAALAVAGCSQPTAPPATLAALETAFTAGAKAGTAYIQLPLCPKNTPLCSNVAVSAGIKLAGAKAYAALVSLRKDPQNITLIDAANAAIAGYVATVPTPGVNQ